MRHAIWIISAVFIGTPALSASAALQRAFVASDGSDGNPCTVASPCRTFAAAQVQTMAGGEILALDAAGYGTIAIDRSISILANPGVYAGISAATGNGITIASPGVDVRLSGLQIHAVGATGSGIVMTSGASLTLENCSVSGFA